MCLIDLKLFLLRMVLMGLGLMMVRELSQSHNCSPVQVGKVIIMFFSFHVCLDGCFDGFVNFMELMVEMISMVFVVVNMVV